MSNQANELKNKYLKEWRAKNKGKTKEYNARYWAKKAQEAEQKEKGRQLLE